VEDVQGIFRLATKAEELGFGSVVAAVTTPVCLGTSVPVLPYHSSIQQSQPPTSLRLPLCREERGRKAYPRKPLGGGI